MSGARTSMYDGRKMYEMLAKRAGKIKHIYTYVECGFPHPCPFYAVNTELISFGQGDLLAHSFKQAKSFLKNLLAWRSWKIISIQSRRSSHCFVTSWTDKFRQCEKYSGRILYVHCFAHGQWSASFFMRDWTPFHTPLNHLSASSDACREDGAKKEYMHVRFCVISLQLSN